VAIRSWAFLALSILGIVLNLSAIIPLYFNNQPSVMNDQKLRVVSFNMFARNKNFVRILDFIQNSNADVVLIQEATIPSLKQFENLRSMYPQLKYQPNRNNHGLVVLSHYPIKKLEAGNFKVPYLLARIKVNNNTVTIANTHLFTPTSSWRFQNRNAELNDLGTIVSSAKGSVIVAGDLNMSVWSPYYAQFKRKTHLKDARSGFGVIPTWPTFVPPVMIPIDHFLVSSNVKVVDLHTGPDIGSDHLPLVLDVVI
jgi:endonuclease/exonuclease/phosphatase (EEP) superfamily protein YafD